MKKLWSSAGARSTAVKSSWSVLCVPWRKSGTFLPDLKDPAHRISYPRVQQIAIETWVPNHRVS